jgi:hypothetical protein
MTELLTKSLFTTALECPRKLYYAVHGNEYDNANSDNDFLHSLVLKMLICAKVVDFLKFFEKSSILYTNTKAV